MNWPPLFAGACSSMGTPKAPQLSGYRIISSFPPHGSDYEATLSKWVPDMDRRIAKDIWEAVYAHGRDLRPQWPIRETIEIFLQVVMGNP